MSAISPLRISARSTRCIHAVRRGWLGLVLTAAMAVNGRAGLPAVPVEQWRWVGDIRSPEMPSLSNTALVAPFTDVNGDGRTDALDGPDVLLPHMQFDPLHGAIAVLDGRTGATRREIIDSFDYSFAEFSVGDVDGDGRNDIVALANSWTRIAAYRNDGSLIWDRAAPEMLAASGLNLADIDEDGLVDVVAGRAALLGDGRSWLGTGGRGSWGLEDYSCVADIDPASPGLEVAAGNTLYSSTGSILWQAPIPDGNTSVADLDGDGSPEIVVVAERDVVVLDRAGRVVGQILGAYVFEDYPQRALLADIDGDGLPEIVVSCVRDVRAFEWSPGRLSQSWTTPVVVWLSTPRPTAFDFDCDGADEVVHRDELRWYVFDGRDGSVIHSVDSDSGTLSEMPVVANIDDDPWAEIIVPSIARPLLVAYEVPLSATPRAIFNQVTFHGTNVDDSGRIPAGEPPHWLDANMDSAQSRTGPPGPCAPDCPAPILDAPALRDPSSCSLGLELAWPAPFFPSGAGVVRIYRSDDASGLSCLDAVSRPPVATNVASPWYDGSTEDGRAYVYVVEAEDSAAADPACAPLGPGGGVIAQACAAPIAEAGTYAEPLRAGPVLRVSRRGADIVLSWPSLRPLLAGEHLHVKRCEGPGPCAPLRVSPEGLLSASWSDPRDATRLLFYDLRIASGCEEESPPDYPPSR